MIKHYVAAALALAFAALAAAAQPRPVTEPPIRYLHYMVQAELRDDFTSSETRSWALKVLNAKALEWAKQARISHSTSVQKVEVLQAYTVKADGRRLEVPRSNFQVQVNQGRESGSPLFSDFSSVTVVFPDLAVGDTVHMQYRTDQTEPIFPGHFDFGETFGQDVSFDEVELSVQYPAALKAVYAARQMQQQEDTTPEGRKRVRWSWRNTAPMFDPRRNGTVANSDDYPGASFSTFADYRAIAQAYGVRAVPKAEATERVRKLAEEVAGKLTEPRAKAKALYEWVSTQITYGGNCVGVGTVVPRELDTVITNRMGDCKDHATLLQALLSAQGIAAEQALISVSAEYTLPRIPRVGSVNHVINYLPTFNLYLDATAKHQPFEVLPIALRGKPVLHVQHWREGARVPVSVPAREQKVQARYVLAADGSLSGTVKAWFKGDAAVGMRQWARELPKESRPDMVRDMLRSMGLVGGGLLDLPDATALTDEYELTLKLDKVERYARYPGQGQLALTSFMGSGGVEQFAQQDDGEPARYSAPCSSVLVDESFEVDLPKAMKITALPPAAKASNSVQRFEFSHQLKGNKLLVRRKIEDRTPVAVCSPALMDEYRVFGGKVLDALKAPILYR